MVDIPGVGDLSNLKMKETIEKFKGKLNFPESKDNINKAVDSLSDVPDQAKTFIKNKLPDRKYNSMEDIKETLGVE